MFGISTNAGGQCMGMPDVCKTPSPGGPVPVPYPNVAMMNQADPGKCSKKVLVKNKNVMTKQSEVTMSSGNEAGSAGGVASSKIKGKATFKAKFSMKVKAEGQNVIHHTVMAAQNDNNVPAGTHLGPSQNKVTVTG